MRDVVRCKRKQNGQKQKLTGGVKPTMYATGMGNSHRNKAAESSKHQKKQQSNRKNKTNRERMCKGQEGMKQKRTTMVRTVDHRQEPNQSPSTTHAKSIHPSPSEEAEKAAIKLWEGRRATNGLEAGKAQDRPSIQPTIKQWWPKEQPKHEMECRPPTEKPQQPPQKQQSNLIN